MYANHPYGGVQAVPNLVGFDHERDSDLKKRLFEIMQKYGIK